MGARIQRANVGREAATPVHTFMSRQISCWRGRTTEEARKPPIVRPWEQILHQFQSIRCTQESEFRRTQGRSDQGEPSVECRLHCPGVDEELGQG
jgi:hypothetical protein